MDLHGDLPYQDEPPTVPDQLPAFALKENPDQIPHNILSAQEGVKARQLVCVLKSFD